MPLHVRRRPDTGALEISGTVRPAGAAVGVRIRRRAGTDDLARAREEAAAIEAEILRAAHHGARPVDPGLGAAILAYLKHEPRSAGTQAMLLRLARHFGDVPLATIDQAAVDRARMVLRPGASPATVKRNVIVPLRAVLTFASRRKWCAPPMFDLPRERAGRTAFLLPAQVDALIAGAAPHLRPLLIFLICTGCRLGEALKLEWDAVDLAAGRALCWEGETKSGHRRVVMLPPAAVAALAALPHRDGPVFRPPPRRRQEAGEWLGYRQSDAGGGGQIKHAWATACRNAGLSGEIVEVPRADRGSAAKAFRPEHSPHVLRHSWASWFYALHRDLLLLKREGGWSSVALVERYAHLMPAGQEAAIRRVWGTWPAKQGAKAG